MDMIKRRTNGLDHAFAMLGPKRKTKVNQGGRLVVKGNDVAADAYYFRLLRDKRNIEEVKKTEYWQPKH